jgi:hypothetical protein
MTKIAAHDRALAFLKEKGSATPAQIEKHVGQGAYASKYVCYLKLRGYEIETVKTGRTVTEYKFISDGDSATRDYQWVPPAKRGQNKTATSNMKSARVKRDAKAVFEKAAKPKASKPVKVRQSKQTPSAPVKKAARNVLKERADAEADRLLAEIGMKNAGEYAGGTYSIDPDWDSMDGIDVANFLK